MKIGMFTPDWPRAFLVSVGDSYDAADLELRDNPPIAVEAETLGQAIAACMKSQGVTIEPYLGDGRVPYTPGQAPLYYGYDGSRGGALTRLTLYRGAEWLDPGHDMDFPLQDGDILDFGAVGC